MLRQHFFGMDSEEVWNACKTVGEMCNLLAMTYLQQGIQQYIIFLLYRGLFNDFRSFKESRNIN